MNYNSYDLLWFFLVYSFMGWIIETIFAGIKKKRFINRGILNGPLCIIYGICGVIISIVLQDLDQHPFFLFLGSAIIATIAEWIAGHQLERINQHKWWDYSDKKFNIDGYVCLQYSVVWGLAGVLIVRYLNGFLLSMKDLLPFYMVHIVLWSLFAVVIIDLVCSLAVILKLTKGRPAIREWNLWVLMLTNRFGVWLVERVGKRMAKAYPSAVIPAGAKPKSTVFAGGCCFYKLFWLFFIGAFIGAVVEIIFCRITMGVMMSRSSLVWGQFSVVWGLGIALITGLVYKYKDQSESKLFIIGTLLGGAFEYLCSVFTELVFGAVFWDYSGIPFNLGGRINLLYCFFWGIAAIIWFKYIYPWVSKLIEKLPKKAGPYITWTLIIFMSLNMLVSSMALLRSSQRAENIAPVSRLGAIIDQQFPDSKMLLIYPKAKKK